MKWKLGESQQYEPWTTTRFVQEQRLQVSMLDRFKQD